MTIAEIAIIGHPNEGKSSVLSTLAEDDSVRISPIPGETVVCRTFPVFIDGTEVLRLTDTPGFQNPQRVLSALRGFEGSSDSKLRQLRTLTGSSAELTDEHELLQPVTRGAAVIYVVDGSRPVRSVDRAEMEILRLIGRPRMAIINCKDEDYQFLDDWKDEFRTRFNSYRLFNAHRATYMERIELLEALKSIDQDWQPLLNKIIEAFRSDWESRTRMCAQMICSLLNNALSLQLVENIAPEMDGSALEKKLVQKYSKRVMNMEQGTHQQIRALFRHNVFDLQLPAHSILREDLFSEKSWQLLGLTQKQFVLIGAIGGATVGAGIDIAALGHGLGLFTALGGVAGTIGALTGRNRLSADTSLLGVNIAGPQILVGPAENITLMFVLINRALLYYQQSINWAHGRRDYTESPADTQGVNTAGFTRNWSSRNLKFCHRYFTSIKKLHQGSNDELEKEMQTILYNELIKISHDNTTTP